MFMPANAKLDICTKKIKPKPKNAEDDKPFNGPSRQMKLALTNKRQKLSFIPKEYADDPAKMMAEMETQQSKIKVLQKEVAGLRDVSTAAHQVILNVQRNGAKLQKPFDEIRRFDPCEEMEKFRQLIKIGRNLDENDFLDLIDSFDITETKYGTTCAYKGVSKEKYDDIVQQKNECFRRYKDMKKELAAKDGVIQEQKL